MACPTHHRAVNPNGAQVLRVPSTHVGDFRLQQRRTARECLVEGLFPPPEVFSSRGEIRSQLSGKVGLFRKASTLTHTVRHKMSRRELWQRTLLRGNGGGPLPADVERLIIRYAGEKGIVDPTNTPIAGMVTTGVRHRAAEAFPWLSHGGYDILLYQRHFVV